jgi:hypothetical protein
MLSGIPCHLNGLKDSSPRRRQKLHFKVQEDFKNVVLLYFGSPPQEAGPTQMPVA